MQNKFTMLVVDDEPNILKSIKRLFVDSDYRILTAPSGEDGLKVLEKEQVHLVISDYRMPNMSGVEFLRRVKDAYPDTLRIILSGYADVGAVVDAINDGQIYKFISKPWNDQEFTTAIMRSFEQYKLAHENDELARALEQRNSELQELADSLEEKVAKRTRDLEIKNRALKVAQNILNLLPIGVIGIDSQGIVVYMNRALEKYLGGHDLSLGASAQGNIHDEIIEILMQSYANEDPVCKHMDLGREVGVIAIPLPDKAGVIGVISCFIEVEKVCKESCLMGAESGGVANG